MLVPNNERTPPPRLTFMKPSTQTANRGHDLPLASRKPRQNMLRASSQDRKGLEDPPAPASITASYRMFDATAAPVPRQLSYHFYSSFRPGSHESSPDHDSVNKVIQQTVPEKTMADGSHVTNASDIESMQAPKDMPSPAAKGSEARRDFNRSKNLTRWKQEFENRESREAPTVLKKRFSEIELPQVASKKARMATLDGSLSPNINIDVPDSSKTRTQKIYVSRKIIDNQPAPTAIHSNSSCQHERQNQDDTDDDEEKPQVLTESQNNDGAPLKAPEQPTLDRTSWAVDLITAACGERDVASIPGKVKKDVSLQDAILEWVSTWNTPSFECARSWVNHATIERLKYGGPTISKKRRAIKEDWDTALEWCAVTMNDPEGSSFFNAPNPSHDELEDFALKIDDKTGFLKAERGRKPRRKGERTSTLSQHIVG